MASDAGHCRQTWVVLTERAHQLVAALRPGGAVGDGVAVGRWVRVSHLLLLLAAGAVVSAPRGASGLRGATPTAATAHLLDDLHLSSQLCTQWWRKEFETWKGGGGSLKIKFK